VGGGNGTPVWVEYGQLLGALPHFTQTRLEQGAALNPASQAVSRAARMRIDRAIPKPSDVETRLCRDPVKVARRAAPGWCSRGHRRPATLETGSAWSMVQPR